MARCTAPVQGHRTASGAAACPACGGRSYGSYPSRSYLSDYAPTYPQRSSGVAGGSAHGSRSARPRWSPGSSSVSYTDTEVRALNPIRITVEQRAVLPELRDVFLCHAWDDREGAAKNLHDLLESDGVSVWFSEKDVGLGTPLLRAIDKGLAKTRVGIVLVTRRCSAASTTRGSLTRNSLNSLRASSSSPLCTTRHSRLSGKSALYLPRDPD